MLTFLSYILLSIFLLVRVKGVQDCATGFPPASNGVRLKDSWKPCDTAAVSDGTDTYCMRAFYRRFKSKKEAGMSLAEAAKKMKMGVSAGPKKWIHTCGTVQIPYQNDLHQEKIKGDALDYMALGVGCDTYGARASHNVKFCFIDETDVSSATCPAGRPDITPHVGIWYNAGSAGSPLQYQIKLCRCRTFDASHECEGTANGANAMRSYHNVYSDGAQYRDDDFYAKSQDQFYAARPQENMNVYPMFLPGAYTPNVDNSDFSYYLMFALVSILLCLAAVVIYCAGICTSIVGMKVMKGVRESSHKYDVNAGLSV